MLQAMYNGVSAILSTQTNMDVIGNNIANVNTTGYKTSRVTFADQLSQTIQGATTQSGNLGGTNGQQMGLGVRIGSVDILNTQGGLLSTNSPTDLAISGNGYFQVGNNTGGVSYTRDGHFAVDNSGSLVSSDTGEHVLGWSADTTGAIDTSKAIDPTSQLSIPIGTLTAALPTANGQFTGNLDATAPTAGTYSSDMHVFDSLGVQHTISVTYTRAADPSNPALPSNTWNWTASGDPSLAAASGTTNQGTVTFDGSGNLASQTGTVSMSPTNGSTAPQSIAVDFSSLTQLAGASTVSAKSQDGYAQGTLQSFAIDQNGVINGVFSNGLNRALGQVAMAQFQNPAGLTKVGNNDFSTTSNSGTALTTTANAGGSGSIQAGYLEQSNVDLGSEFTNMIVAQRSFQANTKIVTTVDQMLNELIDMKQ